MKIKQLYTYPIKSLRGVPLDSSIVTHYGFPYDRRFMLIKDHGEKVSPPRYKTHLVGNRENMTITYYPELALFSQKLNLPAKTFIVTYNPPGGESKHLELPLEPDTASLESMDVSLHGSPARAYAMGKDVDAWFSSILGHGVILAYLGSNKRPVLGNLSPNAPTSKSASNHSWLSNITSSIPKVMTSTTKAKEGLTFADCAAYLLVTEESLQDVSSRLPDGKEMDITKFRANIVVSGASEAYEEDFWGGISISRSTVEGARQEAEIVLTANCGRCVSINVDYSTGQAAQGEEGTILKKMTKDRRVDKGNKYSPIFGRYGFLNPSGASQTIAVGDEVTISRVNESRTTFDWPNMGS